MCWLEPLLDELTLFVTSVKVLGRLHRDGLFVDDRLLVDSVFQVSASTDATAFDSSGRFEDLVVAHGDFRAVIETFTALQAFVSVHLVRIGACMIVRIWFQFVSRAQNLPPLSVS